MRGIAATATDSVIGLESLGYTFWVQALDVALAVIDDIAELAQEGVGLPNSMHFSRISFIPKAELIARGEAPRCTPSVLWLSRPTQLPHRGR